MDNITLEEAHEAINSLTAQVEDLYAERQELFDKLGVSSLSAVAEMIDSLEEQLKSLYAEKESA